MKLLVVGSDQPWTLEPTYVRYLVQLGCDCRLFSSKRIFNDYYSGSLWNRVKFRFGVSSIYKTINELLKKEVQAFGPEVVWVFKGMEIFPESLSWMRDLGIPLVNYNADNPFIFSGKGSGNHNVTDSIRKYDLHFTYNLGVKKQLEVDYEARTAVLPFGFDVSEQTYRTCEELQEIFSVCFLGNADDTRADFIRSLADRDVSIAVYGYGWGKFIKHKNVIVHEAVVGDEFWKVLRKYRVQLNLMRIHNEDSHNMRTFEVPAIGGILLAPDNAEHRQYFKDGEEMFLYNSLDRCAALIKMMMNFSKVEADRVRNAARRRSINSGYSYKDRAHQALVEISDLVGENRSELER